MEQNKTNNCLLLYPLRNCFMLESEPKTQLLNNFKFFCGPNYCLSNL